MIFYDHHINLNNYENNNLKVISEHHIIWTGEMLQKFSEHAALEFGSQHLCQSAHNPLGNSMPSVFWPSS